MRAGTKVFYTTVKGEAIAYPVRHTTKDGVAWVSATDVCMIADVHLKRVDEAVSLEDRSLRRWAPEGSVKLITGVQRRGRGLVMLNREGVEHVLRASFRHYVPEFRSWLETERYTVPTITLDKWLALRGFEWPNQRRVRLGRLGIEEAKRRGITVSYEARQCVSGGVLVDTQAVEWPVGFLDELYADLSGE
jgi:hypothetical protein